MRIEYTASSSLVVLNIGQAWSGLGLGWGPECLGTSHMILPQLVYDTKLCFLQNMSDLKPLLPISSPCYKVLLLWEDCDPRSGYNVRQIINTRVMGTCREPCIGKKGQHTGMQMPVESLQLAAH